MRRLEPQASHALPPISCAEVLSEVGGWTVTERRPPLGLKVTKQRKTSQSPRSPRQDRTVADVATKETRAASARGEKRELDPATLMHTGKPPPAAITTPSNNGGAENAGSPTKPMKGRTIENWLNNTLGQATKEQLAAKAGKTDVTSDEMGEDGEPAQKKQDVALTQFEIDNAALDKLGLDEQTAERVYRAMFVYSQGMHAVLQEAVGRAKSRSQAMRVLWRAFTAVLEHAGQAEQSGAESLAALVQRGNEEEKERIDTLHREQVAALQGQGQKLAAERRTLQEELQRLREDERWLRNECDMYRQEHEASIQKYEKEFKQRVDAEVRFLDKTHFCESLQEQLDKEQRHNKLLQAQLKDETGAKKVSQVENDSLRTQVKVLEAQAAAYKQSVMEAAQQKQRHEQQVGQLKQQIERMGLKTNELKEQLEGETDTTKRLTEQTSNQQREMRKLERQCEDESHGRKEIQNERDLLRDKFEKLDKDLAEHVEERRALQKQFNDLSMDKRTNQIELKRKTEMLERSERQLEKVQTQHRELLDQHRALQVESDNLREDVEHLDGQVTKESDLRKHLQQDKKQMTGQMQNVQIQLDTTQLALQSTQKELQEVTEMKVKLESIVRDTKSAMQKINLEHQVELKAHVQKVAMLEKVIADERNERRALVAETQEVSGKREDALEQLKRKDAEARELKRQRLEKEEEVDRYKVLLKAQEQRNMEQLVTVDKYHAAVASHDAETRQMQVLLECEREEAKRQLCELQDAYAAARSTLEQRIEYWKLRYEDVLSQLNFNPATEKIQVMEVEIEELRAELNEAKEYISAEMEKVKNVEQELIRRDDIISELRIGLAEVQVERDLWISRHDVLLHEFEHQSVARNDAEHRCERIRQNTEAFDQMKDALEEKIAQARQENDRLVQLLNKPQSDAETQVYLHTEVADCQTDLSYQYLESSERLQTERGRRERLDILKKASRFVEDAEVRRDFTVQMRSSAMPVAQVGSVEITFDGRQNGAAERATFTATSTSSGSQGKWKPDRSGGTAMATMEAAISASVNGARSLAVVPPPAVGRPPGPPGSSQRSAQGIRSSRAGAEAQSAVRSGLTPSPW